MDRSNNGDSGPQHTMSRAEYSRNMRAAMEERRQRAMANRQQYQPQIHEQIQRLFKEYDAPFYARIRGFGRAQTLALAESTVLGLAAGTDRRLSDTETQALTEHFLSSVHNMLAWKWAMTGLAGYMAYRGRHTMRFPFFKPVITGGRLDPATGGPQVRIMWHTARFAAYYGAFWLIGEPIFQGVNFMRQSYSMDQDPRLASLLRDGRKQAGEVLGSGQDSNNPYAQAWKSESQQSDSQTYESSSSSSSSSPSASTSNGYNYDQSYQQTSQPSQSQTSWRSPPNRSEPTSVSSSRRDGWDVTDDIDDASPIAPAAQAQSSNPQNYSGSAWDRVRQQSQYNPQHNRPQGRKTWEAPQDTQAGWGSADDASPQYRGDSYAYSAEETEKATAKSQAQKDFDAMLERERSGDDDNRRSWGRR